MIVYTRFKLQHSIRRWRRKLRRQRAKAVKYSRTHIFGKGPQFALIRRFILGWWFIVIVAGIGLAHQTQALRHQGSVLQPLPGGNYSEAVVGSIKNINPVLPEGSATADANHLIFSGLTRFNTNGDLEPDIAKGWEVSADGKTYTFHLKRNARWHDGVPCTAQDVVFTLTAIQNPDTRSPLAASWQGVQVAAPDDYTVVFTLTKPYTPFINATTVGLLPRHLLENTEPSALRVAQFNQKPVGTGPFKLEHFDATSGELSLAANPTYHFGRPFIDQVTLRLYSSYERALDAYSHRQVEGVARIQPSQIDEASSLGRLKLHAASVPDQVGVFLKTTSPLLSTKEVRQALALATDRSLIVQKLFDGEATQLTGPLLASHLSLGSVAHQPPYDHAKAGTVLDAAGWHRGADGVRAKDGKRLELKLVTQAHSPYGGVAKELSKQWGSIGVKLNITEVPSVMLQQSYIRPRSYDALLYGINVGADPDVYAFWDSSQVKDPGLNLSAYSSSSSDAALESGRIIRDPAIRAAKYRSFIQSWVNDTPAVMLYTPTYEYGTDASVYGVHIHKLINPSDRFTGIEKWSVRVREVRATQSGQAS